MDEGNYESENCEYQLIFTQQTVFSINKKSICEKIFLKNFKKEKQIPDKLRYISGQISIQMKTYKKTQKPSSKAEEPAMAYATTTYADKLLDVNPDYLSDSLNRVEAFRKGFKKKSLEKLKEMTGLDYPTLALALSVSTKTLQRTEIFDVVQSEKMYELAELYALGISYFGKEGFRRWMDRPLFTLGNRRPLELLDVSAGIDLLHAEIMRLQHGIAI